MTTPPQTSAGSDLKRELGLFDAVMINAGTMIALAVGFAKYIGFFTPLSESGIRIIAIVSIIGLTVLNCRGVRLGATTQNVLTTLKIGALIALIVTSFVIPGGSVSHFQPLWP